MVSVNRQTDVNVIAVTQIENLDEVKQGHVPLVVAAVCMNAQVDKSVNLATFAKYMEAAAERNVHLIVFPEIALQQNPGWGQVSHKPTQEELVYVQDTAEPIPGASTTWLTQKASDLEIYIVFGMTELGKNGDLYNSSVFLGPKGVLGIHRKHILWDAATKGNEHCFWRTGNVPGQVIDSPIGKVGLMICIEMAFEYGPRLVEAGADVLVTVSAWPEFAGEIFERVTKQNAAKSVCWHIVANQTGPVGHATDFGHSRIVDSNGNLVSDTGFDEGMVIGQIPLLIDKSSLDVKH